MNKKRAKKLLMQGLKQLRHIRPSDIKKYSHYYKEQGLQDKVVSLLDVIGEQVLIPILQLYYVLKAPSTPVQSKLIITAALGYFILPTDFLPDFLGALGLIDDIAVVSFVMKQVQKAVTPEVEAAAAERYRKLVRCKK